MAWIGFRTPENYDQPGLYGLEYRAAGPSRKRRIIQSVLRRLQSAMLMREYGITEEQMRLWLSRHASESAAIPVANAHYNQFSLPPEILTGKTPKAEIFRKSRLSRKLEEHQELKMLLHDWSQDILFYDNPAAAQKILSEQLRALSRLQQWYNPFRPSINQVMKDFLRRSGLYKAVARSFRAP